MFLFLSRTCTSYRRTDQHTCYNLLQSFN